jgi:hypothetical protein
MLTLAAPRHGSAAAAETNHTVRHASLTLARAGQAALLRQALPLALQAVFDRIEAEASEGAPAAHHRNREAEPRLVMLRHLPCRLRLAPDASLHQAVQALQVALRRAWAEARSDAQQAGEGSPGLAFDDAAQVLTGAFADALTGRRDRSWAWVRLGLWPAEPGADTAGRLHRLLQALDRQPMLPSSTLPELAPPVRRRALLVQLLQQGLLPRALALLTPLQCLHLAQGLPGHQALAAALGALQAGPAAAGPGLQDAAVTATPLLPIAWPDGPEAAACRAAMALAPLPPSARAAAALWLAWLAQGLADPGVLAGPSIARVQARLQALAGLALAPRRASSSPPERPAAGGLAPAARSEWTTRHGGLVHLLPLLAEALPPRAEGWSRTRLLRLAVHGLQVPLGDAVLAPWLGAAAPAPWADVPPSPADGTADALQADVAALLQALQQRLQRHLAPERRADIEAAPWPWLLHRPAKLHTAPGGWQVHFGSADTRLRLCGLDRDPGFLPELGLTVVLRYE